MGWLKRTALFLAKAIPIGLIVVALLTWVTGHDLSILMAMHGLFEFVLLCAFLGGLLVWFFTKLGSGSEHYENTKKDVGEAVTEIKKLRASAKRSSKEQQAVPNDTVDGTNTKRLKKKSVLIAVAQVTAAQATYNAVSNPIVVPLNGGTVHGANPKGMNQWEIHYSVPLDSQVHRKKYGRGTVGFNHGQYQFRITWPSVL
jgi:hypothetical protein